MPRDNIRRMGRKRTKDRDLPSRVYLRHGAYFFVEPSGKWIRLADTKPAALRALADLLEPSASTFAKFAEKYRLTVLIKKHPATQKTQGYQIDRLVRVFGHMRLDEIRRGHVARYRDERPPVAANRELALLQHMFARAVEWELLDENPCAGVSRNTEKARDRYVTDEEFLAVYETASPMIRVMMALALLTGQREADLLKLRKSDITKEGIRFKQGKTGKRLIVRWSDALVETIEAAAQLPVGVESIHIVCNASGQPYSSSGFQTAWQRHIKTFDDKVERFTFHDLRAKAASDGQDGRLLGHASAAILHRVYQRKPELVSPTR